MHDSVCHAHCAFAKRDQSDFSRDTWGCKSSSCHKFALCSGRVRQREGGEEEERRSSAHDYAIISHTWAAISFFLHCNCCKLQLQVALSFQQVLQHLRMLKRFSNHFSLIIRQCSRSSSSRAQRPSQRSQLTLPHTPLPLRCFILLRCIFRCASCSAVALRRAVFASASNVLVCCRCSSPLSPSLSSTSSLCSALSFAHHVLLLLQPPRALLLRSRCRCLCLCSLSLPLSLSSLWQFRARSFDLAPACLVPLCTAPVVCIQISSLSLPLFRCLCCRWTELFAALNWQARRGGAGKFKLWLPLWGSATYSQLQPELNST